MALSGAFAAMTKLGDNQQRTTTYKILFGVCQSKVVLLVFTIR